MSLFKKAERKQAKLRLAITGPSGAGKTYSALKIASGMGGKIAFIDTENSSAALYADEFNFDCLNIDPPYTTAKYKAAIDEAVRAGYDIVVIDSLSHAWAGEGGILQQKTAIDARGGNSYTNWAKPTADQESFIAKLLHTNIHLISTMRSKQDYVLDTNERGRQVPRKVGLAPVQREGTEFEFTMVIDMDMSHNATVSKTRIKSFDGRIWKPDESTGKELVEWLSSGSPADSPEANNNSPIANGRNPKVDKIEERLAAHYGGDHSAMNAGLMLITEHKKDGETKFVTLEELPDLTDAWLDAILRKMDEQGVGA